VPATVWKGYISFGLVAFPVRLYSAARPEGVHFHKNAAPKDKFTAKELDMASILIRQLTTPFRPEQFHDTYRENVERRVKEKQKGKKITTISQPTPVIDLMEALQRSLKSAAPQKGEAKPHRTRSVGRKTAGRRKAA
jgi:DNA end-binding protein Ku